jgi:molybdenum cofactor biosynthesis enzyme MoaA
MSSLNKKAYCPMPFVTLTVNPGGHISRCMMSLGSMGPIESYTLGNKNFRTLRKNMLNGIFDKEGCSSCYETEQNGGASQRLKWLEREERYLGETGIYESNQSIAGNNNIYHLYMNFNNICNFKCRMCGPHFSNAWIPDWKKMKENPVGDYRDPTRKVPLKQQVDVKKFFKEFGRSLSNLKQIWITGGEPFMDDSIYDFFKELPKYADVSDIKVVVNTNLSKVDLKKLPELFVVKDFLLNVSIDATGELYEYMRAYNYSFKDVDTAIREACKLKDMHSNFRVSVNGAFQIYNVLDVENFFNWAAEILDDPNGNLIEMRVLNGPKHLRARHAPAKWKTQSRQMVKRLKEKFPGIFYLDFIDKELEKPADPTMVKLFHAWSEQLDDIRGQDLSKIISIKQAHIEEGIING